MTSQHLTHVPAPDGLAPSPQYSHVVWGTGRFIAISGQCALDASGAVVGEGDAVAQAHQVFANLERCLAAAGAGFGDVVKLTYFVTDVAHLPAVRDARDAYFAGAPLPASSAVQVSALVRPELLLEIEAFALVPEQVTDVPDGSGADLRLIR
ncbi:Putative translation initiation inhibitor [Streptomyces venezuelae]|uniref:RidA family protein n=1 Tax=Streptomyces gardneri TaxID=66892 RepID=UPI0006BE09E6|nr:RidA family protein [Streptomyces gardneri]ALO11960.1 Putative translation initiation inhibitor [Streptomyces venezuelae]QPK48808.1 RidA family protein [Streptomyces gardneri]WRK40290.1 RidA family protein [Streptomyces venezuelae]CUM37472.1 Bona fide RidA/YjgF/TdcF/RutC subgroup [Streptomyces venezuelae]